MAKRIAQSSVNWGALAERVPSSQKPNFALFKAKSDGYLRRVLANPAEVPKIDWAFYKANIPIAGMVENFQKQFEALKIPYPADNVTSKVEAQAQEVKAAISSFVGESNSRIAKSQEELKHLKSLLTYDQMTMEDYRDAHPEEALDPINRPTFWPHEAEDQPGYQDPSRPASADHH